MKNTLRPLMVLFVALTVLTGLVYPVLVTSLAQALFAPQAEGSLVQRGGKTVGSLLIGQNFTDPGHFWGRPSATSPQPNNGVNSGGSNLGALNPALVEAAQNRIHALQAADPENKSPVPVDLVSASASGLDPHISIGAAQYQTRRVAQARKLDESAVASLVEQATDRPLLGVLGEPVVNVLRLNMSLDALGRP